MIRFSDVIPYLESRRSALLLLVHQVKYFQPQDNGEDQDRKRPSPGPIGEVGAGSLEKRLIRRNAEDRRLIVGGSRTRDEATVCSGNELRCGAEAVDDEA